MFERKFESLFKIGRLTIIGPADAKASYGVVSPEEHWLDVVVRVRDTFTLMKITLRPGRYLGEAYIDGSLSLEKGTLWDLLEICGRNLLPGYRRYGRGLLQSILRPLLVYLQQHNPLAKARHNASHHYDLSYDLYRIFLDSDLQYSCAYFRDSDMTLEEAQSAKKQHIAAKMLLSPGQRVLDIGCGWGGLALYMAEKMQVRVLGVTLSQEQLSVARRRVGERGLEHLVAFELEDYREMSGQFDRIVSVGMFEHVGLPQYGIFFDTLCRLLTDDGVALIHAIGRMSGPGLTSAWLRKYIFPGGYVPALSEVLGAVERSDLWVTDVEVWRLHYAATLRHWRERFLKQREDARQMYDERFCRMWEFYLAASEMSFRYDDLMVFQIQLSKTLDAVPLTRDYMFSADPKPPQLQETSAQ
ncbi:MAG: class I SAM-dependent methyltransferase [Proteobacteria bacterium]|nr:class I SAM-dependent methyltransferase [Pseudomonadota bacterium]